VVEIVEINGRLDKEPALVNTAPYGDGWMVKIKVSDASELDELMPADEYEEYIQTESGK